jgi:hypothetical protein
MATIEVQESVYKSLAAMAQAEGLSLEGYLKRLSEARSIENGKLPRLTGEEFDKVLDAEANNDSTYEGTYPRADLYFDHD